MKIVLENERPISWNKFYGGMHWSVRQAEAQRVHLKVMWELQCMAHLPSDMMLYKMDCSPFLFSKRVDIHITAYFKNRPQDPDNICSKLYIDGLIGNVIENDTRQFVRKVTVQSEIDRENPRVEIEITEV